MYKPSLAELNAFAAVARHRSFRLASDALGLSRSSLSHTVIGLERGLEVRLLHRTTRSVSLTEVGERLLARLGPLLRDLDEAIEEAVGQEGIVRGTLRINCGDAAAEHLLATVVPTFLDRFPSVALDLVTDGRLIDIVAAGFDAGVRLREAVPQDMVAVPFGDAIQFLPVAAPTYLARFGTPLVPDDLRRHRCIQHRLPSGRTYRWEFEKHNQELTIDLHGALSLDSNRLMVMAAADGLGIAFVHESAARPHLRDGKLVPVLADWCPPVPGLCLYYPGHRQVPVALRAFIDVLRERASGP
ncbi:LysR family transcriptional regulator [Lichenibacterium minor]|uniref:LysR family transcriptional regulator n=1 Tax=Lichenibacterium minor TaxID=2316528 RepID=A0A4Q2U2Z9_9HYPH|nr:LysR family transcriptional regulator [Lichenibacterium minor]RYC29085.1 LysR family transcriptional regulator [Lichenibacterium minor]